ncbi:MAG: hypothetical protein ACI9MC_001469 [Kiritimatiellia bacterium]|jgi:hypothetical protein
MALELPCVHLRLGEGSPAVESMSRPTPLNTDELAVLVALDSETKPHSPPGDRCLPLPSGVCAVGRGGFGGVTWRILSSSDIQSLPHPAWLWRSSRWFDPTAPPRGPVPNSVPLRAQLDPSTRLGGTVARTRALLASAVAAIRQDRRPVAIIIDPNDLPDPAPPGRWFLLALLTMLPKDLALSLRVSTYERHPSPEWWDVVITSEPPDGFVCLRPQEQAVLRSDPVAYFIYDRLMEDQLEVVETAASWSAPGAADPWAAGIDEQWTEQVKETAVTNSPAPKRSGDKAGSTPRRLLLKTAEAWLSLLTYSEDERARIVSTWLSKDGRTAPDESILNAVARVRPIGRDTEAWCAALVEWSASGPSRAAAVRRLGEVLDTEALRNEPTVRASLWTEYLVQLLAQGHAADAQDAFTGNSAHQLMHAGASLVIAVAWMQLPLSRRPDTALVDLIDRFSTAPDGDAAVAWLWQALIVAQLDQRADLVLQRWAQLASLDRTTSNDTLMEVLSGSPQAIRWVGHAARSAPPEMLWALIAPVTHGPDDPLWEHCVDVRTMSGSPEDRIADLIGLPDPQVRRLERELRTVASSVRVWRFPDPAVAEGATRLANLPDRSPLWLWLALCARHPHRDADGRVAAALESFCQYPPSNPYERKASFAMAEAVGFADQWAPIQHAEWLLRLGLAPNGDGTDFAHQLCVNLLRGMARRPEGALHMAEFTNQLGMLPPDHPVVTNYLHRLLPTVYPRGAPVAYVENVQSNRWPSATRHSWRRVVETLGLV